MQSAAVRIARCDPEEHAALVGLVPADDQRRWEGEAAERGVRRYRETQANRALDATPPGVSVVRDLMPGVVAEIERLREEALDSIATPSRGRPADWWWLVIQLPADKQAFLAIRTILAGIPRERLGRRRRVTATALAIADCARVQIEYERWVTAEKSAQAAAKKAGEERDDLLLALKSRRKVIDRRAWDRWCQKIGEARGTTWPLAHRVAYGAILVDAAVRGGGGWIEQVVQLIAGGRTERQLILSDEAIEAIQHLEQRASLARPLRFPMLCPPRPWQWVDERTVP